MKITKNIYIHEVICPCGCGLLPPADFLIKAQEARDICNFPWRISSGARCPEYNKSKGYTQAHSLGAIDIVVSGDKAYTLIKAALEVGMTGIGVKQFGNHSRRFIHIDDIIGVEGFPRPFVWSYR